jgi:hypothetical protein
MYTSIVGRFLKSNSDLDKVVRALIQEQRKLASSTNFAVRFRILWTAALLDKRLTQCTDPQIGELLVLVQERFGIFEAEFGICHHARRRLLLRIAKENLTR